MPSVSVIMPVYNAAPYLKESIESILNQTYRDFEFLIFNDGSTDNSAEIIKLYKDPRIRFYNCDKNFGYVKYLNDGIRLAAGDFIVRMDADDISLPKRLEKQISFLNNNYDVGLVGSWIGFTNKSSVLKYPSSDENIKLAMFFWNPLAHPTIVFRKSLFVKNNLSYDNKYRPAEDYKLWTEMVKHTKIRNLKEKLLLYRVHSNQVSIKEMGNGLVSGLKRNYLINSFQFLDEDDINFLFDLICSKNDSDEHKIASIENRLRQILHKNERCLLLSELTNHLYFRSILDTKIIKPSTVVNYLNSPLFRHSKRSYRQTLSLIYRCRL